MARFSLLRHWPLLAAFAFGWFVFSRAPGESTTEYLTPGPTILQKVQALGELRTARYTYSNVFEYRTSRAPAPWARTIGLGGLVESATRNKALASVTGTVEAGVDLREATVVSTQPLVLELPRPTIYRPKLDGTVHQSWTGMFWHDANIGLKALRAMESKLVEAAKSQGIESEARKNASEVVAGLLRKTGVEAEIRFR